MTDSLPAAAPAAPAAQAEPKRFTPLLLLLFAGSGCAALVYEVVWFHLLRLVIGSSAISLAFLLGTFMGGMCLGSWLLPRVLSPRHHPLRAYAWLELGIGAIGLLLPVLLPWAGTLYAENVGHGMGAFLWRGVICAAALLLPTMLMGATLPAIARWLDTSRQGIARLGWFYGANIAGAVFGTLLAGFYLLRVHDILVATWFAVAVNAVVAAAALVLASRTAYTPTAVTGATTERGAAPAIVYLAIAASGFTALGAEVLWTRLLSLLFGASVYTFSLILAVFLLGLGIGSSVGSRLARRTDHPRLALALCQLLLVPSLLFTAFMITVVVPFGEPTWLFQAHVYQNAVVHSAWDFLRCALAIGPGTVLWGASFPLALAAAGRGQPDPGRLVGGIYAANTVGAIGGALVVGLLLIGAVGSQRTQQGLAVLAGMTALLLLARQPWPWASPRRRWLAVLAPLLLVGAVLLTPSVPNGLIAFGRTVQDWDDDVDYLHVAEGINSSVAVTTTENTLCFHVSGKVVASTDPLDMRLQRMLGHLPGLLHPGPRTALVVGCGAGVTAGCFTGYPTIERIVICEIEPAVVAAARTWFHETNRSVLTDQRTIVVIDDARHYLATTRERFDIVTSDPIHPWVRGAAALYSAEYYDLVKQRLAPGGIVTQWVPLYQTDEASVKSQIGTFMRAFPGGTLWNSDPTDHGYDLVMLAKDGPMVIDVDQLEVRLEDHLAVAVSLAQVEITSAVQLLHAYAGQARDLESWLADAQINEDRSLRLQYLAGLSLDVYRDSDIYGAICATLRYPDGLFVASEEVEESLRQAFAK